jgi:glutathione S-transferase
VLEVFPPNEVDGGESFVMTESMVLVDYIAEKFGCGTVSPETPEDRAVARLFNELCSGAFNYFPLLRSRGDYAKTASCLADLKAALAGCEAFLQAKKKPGGPFLLGSKFSTTECAAAPFVQRACLNLPHFMGPSCDLLSIADEQGHAAVASWMRAVLARPSVETTGVDPEQSFLSVAAMLKRFEDADAAAKSKSPSK